MNGAIIGVFLVIIAYLVMMLAIGFFYSKGNNDSSDFYLGGRKLGPFVTAMSAEASDMSSWLLMGLPGVAYLSGICDASWTAIGLAIGTYLNWLIVAKRIRRYSIACDAITIPDFFSKRYHDKKNILMCIVAITILIFFIPYTASGFKAVGTLFNSLFGVNYHMAMLFGAAIIIIYTVMGGFMAVSTTDLIQSVVMSIALVIIVFFGISKAGGWDAVMDNAKSLAGYLSMTQAHNMADNTSSPYSLLTIFSTVAWGLGYFGMPHILLRFMAIGEEKKLVLSRRIATVWVVISMFVAILIGIIGGLSEKQIVNTFITGAADMMSVVLVIALARGISVLMASTGLDVFVLDAAANALAGLSGVIFAPMSFLVYFGLSFLIPSTSGMATVSMPIMGPLAVKLGFSPEVMVMIFSAAIGVVNLFTPTSGAIMGGLALAKIEWTTWLKFALKLIVALSVVCAVILTVACVLL